MLRRRRSVLFATGGANQLALKSSKMRGHGVVGNDEPATTVVLVENLSQSLDLAHPALGKKSSQGVVGQLVGPNDQFEVCAIPATIRHASSKVPRSSARAWDDRRLQESWQDSGKIAVAAGSKEEGPTAKSP